jgi:hypothetical protein
VADRYLCLADNCQKLVAKTKSDRYRSHTRADGEPCSNSSEEIPPGQLELGPVDPKADPGVPEEGRDFATCGACGRKVKLTRLGYYEPHDKTLRGGDRCLSSGVRAFHSRKIEDVPLLDGDLPGEVLTERAAGKVTVTISPDRLSPAARAILSPGTDEVSASTGSSVTSPDASATDTPESSTTEVGTVPDAPAVAPGRFLQPEPVPSADSGVSTETSSPGSPTTWTPSDPSTAASYGARSGEFLQPASPFLQPEAYAGPVKGEPMGDLAKELATKVKETFYAYSNRRTKDNRSAQTTLGPSEIGTPCDRRLAMALLGVVPVNPGGDGWAAFVGTCTHIGMAEVYTFADAGTGRYAVELPVFLGTPAVPRGTTDLLDRRDGTVVDWKIMGKYSLDKFKKEGPSATYRTQAHVYGLGAEKGGEKVRNVAVVGLPRAGSSLDEMHVWTEKFDRKFAQAALNRVERISNEISVMSGEATVSDAGPTSAMGAAEAFATADDCRYCPFHLKGDKEMTRGCPGN